MMMHDDLQNDDNKDDGFVMVTGRKKGKKNTPKRNNSLKKGSINVEELTYDQIDPQRWVNETLKAAFLSLPKNFVEAAGKKLSELGPFDEIVCLGIGRLYTKNAQLQVALILKLLESYVHGPYLLSTFDPLFDAHDREALDLCGFRLLDDNAKGASHKLATSSTKTLFYMPHCNIGLYNNILCVNWDPQDLSRIVFLGNSLTNYTNRTTETQGQCMHAILPYVSEYALPSLERNSYTERAFSDMIVTWFTDQSLADAKEVGVLETVFDIEEFGSM